MDSSKSNNVENSRSKKRSKSIRARRVRQFTTGGMGSGKESWQGMSI